MDILPSYLFIDRVEWENKEAVARSMLYDCTCCPRYCHVKRSMGETGGCRAGSEIFIACADAHFGEEPPISGDKGSGNIFFSFCTMRCIYCQNYTFSQLGMGKTKSIDELCDIMLSLQEKGCHNINLVTPAHFIPLILFALRRAIAKGLRIPIVYNTSSYESRETLSLMNGVIDIYLADMRYDTPQNSQRYSGAADYPQVSREAIKEMYRQVGHLILDENGIAKKGLIIRHLVLPEGIAGSRGVFKFVATEISKIIPVSLMGQYFPAHMAGNYPELNRHITREEYEEVLSLFEEYGLKEGWIQDLCP